MKKFSVIGLIAAFAFPLLAGTTAHHLPVASPVPTTAQSAVPPGESDQTLHAMHDEMERARTRLQIPGVSKPFYIEYRLMDLDVRTVTASFGSLVNSSTSRNRIMSVDVRVGDYHLDSSNFISEDGFQGFLGSTGQVGIGIWKPTVTP